MPASKRLRDLVRDIRATRTAAEERAIVNRECALIRDSFREENNVFRYRNVAKLLYIHMLGYPAHFGQLECLKLIASPRFTDKRVGYLGAMLLLDERTDVHLLVTNSLKNDLNHPTAYVVSLALCTLGSICSTEMSRDLAGEVERLIKSHNPYLKKKAILCAYQIIRKVPELMEMFIPCTRGLLNDKNHGVLLASCCLIQEMCERSPDTLAYFRKQLVPTIIRTLKHVIATGYSPDHDVNRVTDPFLQVKLLRLMRVLGHGDPTVSESMNDILAQVATNTDTSRNVGNAILYEIVLTIMGIESDPGLRVLAINILGRFLLSNFRDIRYVALNTLLRVVHADSQPIQRHRLTIVDCLSDLDVSIKRRAVDLCFALINRSNVRSMVKELILYLQHCDAEFKGDLCSNLVTVTEKYAPNKQWHIDSLLSMLMTAGNYARDDVVSSLISLIAQNEELHACATKHLYSALRTTLTQQPLVQVASWVIGEYGDLLLSADQNDPGVTENEVIDLLHSALVHPSASLASKQMVLTALTKLTTRFSTDCHPRLKEIIQSYTSNVQLDLQQRSVEYEKICSQSNEIRNGLLDYMPAPTPRGLANGFEHSSPEKSEDNPTNVVEFANEPILNGMKAAPDSALTILDLLGEPEKNGTDSHDHQTSSTAAANQPGASNDLLELLDIFAPTSAQPVNHTSDDLLSGLAPIPQPTSTTSNSHPTNPGQATSTGGLDLANELSQLGLTSSSQPNSAPPLNVYDANGLKVVFHFDQPQPVPNEKRRQLTIRLVATATSSHPIEGFEFQAAVPKSCQLQILPASSTTIQPGMLSSPLSQQLKIWYNPKTPIRMRVRLQYTHDGQPRLEQFQLDTFPPVLWQ